MEAHSCCLNKYLLYGLLVAGSWLLSCLLPLHQFSHVSLFRYPYLSSHRRAGPAGAVSLFPSPPAIHDDGTRTSCEGRRVYMLDLPSQFNLLRDCVDGSPAFEDEGSACVLMSNAGLGPVLAPVSGNDTDHVIPGKGWFNTNHHALEVIFHHRMRRYECLTADPAAATAVYVPYYAALELNHHTCDANASARNAPSGEFLRWLSSRPRWAALGGRDHFMLASRTTWMLRLAPGGDGATGCGNSFLDRPECLNMTVLTIESNIWDRRDMAVPYPTYFHPSSAAEVAAWQARARETRRPWLFAFAGARRPNGTRVLRDRLVDKCVASPGRCGMLDCSHGLVCHSAERLMSLFASSRFCLQPRGDSFMRRSSIDAVVAGCIPVFFHEGSTFEKQYRWHEPDNNGGEGDVVHGLRRYSVFIDEDQLLEGKVDVEEVLGRYSDEEVAAMREELIKMIPRFVYKDPRVRFEGDMKDGFDIAMDEVMARTTRIRNGEDLGWDV
uniref:Uncharacterized protein n=1 Tax=Avena sativa TaxID=4498 RepID=A0ACD5ZIY2_AVESA